MPVALLKEVARLWCLVAHIAPIVAYRPAFYQGKAHSLDRDNGRKPCWRKCSARVYSSYQLWNHRAYTARTSVCRYCGYNARRSYGTLREARKGYLRADAEEEPRLRRGVARYACEQLHRLYPHEDRACEGNGRLERTDIGERRHRFQLYGHHHLRCIWSNKAA